MWKWKSKCLVEKTLVRVDSARTLSVQGYPGLSMVMAYPGDRPSILNYFKQFGGRSKFLSVFLFLNIIKAKRHLGWPTLIPHNI